jgi:hypothetical protein
MRYEITAKPGFLRASLFDGETVEQTREFLRAVILENKTSRCECVLLRISTSRPIFHYGQHGLFDHFKELTAVSRRVGLLGDTKELNISLEYIALLAQQRGLSVRSFRDEPSALRWLKERRQRDDRRHGSERRRQSRRVETGSHQAL